MTDIKQHILYLEGFATGIGGEPGKRLSEVAEVMREMQRALEDYLDEDTHGSTEHIIAWACQHHHCQASANDGRCFQCGSRVKPAVCRYSVVLGIRCVKANGFVRWHDTHRTTASCLKEFATAMYGEGTEIVSSEKGQKPK